MNKTVFLILDYDDPYNIMDAILINSSDYETVTKTLELCDSMDEKNNKYYDDEYHGFYEYLKEKNISYEIVDIASYSY